MLTIAIPTYNRPLQLQQRLAELYPQLKDGIEVLVIDNASDKWFEQNLAYKDAPIRTYRNPANIGMAANIIRCIEKARGEWVWLLGDDDGVLPNAISTLLKSIEQVSDETDIIKFNSGFGVEIEQDSLFDQPSKLASLISNPDFYSSFLFISNSVVRHKAFLSEMGLMYKFTNTLAPHVVAFLSLAQKGSHLYWFKKNLIAYNFECKSSWEWHQVRDGFLEFQTHDFGRAFPISAMRNIYLRYLGKPIWYRLLVMPYKVSINPYRYWNNVYLRVQALMPFYWTPFLFLARHVNAFGFYIAKKWKN